MLDNVNRDPATPQEILDLAIPAVERETGLRLTIERLEGVLSDFAVDAVLRVEPGGQPLLAEVKKWAQHKNLGALINELKQLPGEGLLVADYVNPNMGSKLREHQVQFIDTAGNAFLSQPQVYVFVTGNRSEPRRGFMPTKDDAKRAFEPKGLAVVYAFLRDPNLVNIPYRDIAEQTGVAVGTVGWVINALKAAEFVRDKGEHGRCLVHVKKLLERWVQAWPEKLKPKQFVGEFLAEDPYWWEGVNIREYGGYWGGEIAAAKYTEYLKPKGATVYLPEHALPRLLRDARLRKATEWTGDGAGTVRIYRPFWPEQAEGAELEQGLVHPILVYADLLETGDPRNLEAARRLYDERIAQQSCRD